MQVQLNESQQWQAVQGRDGRYDGSFVFAVRSTGIYCRPSCPARRPRPEQIVFFSEPEAAERAGFRPCKRCRPRERDGQVEIVEEVCRIIEERFDEPLTLASLGSHVGLSPFHLQRTFKRLTGITPHQYLDARRLRHFKERLQAGSEVTAALYDAGYGSSSRLYERSNGQLGMAPRSYRQGGEALDIAYTVLRTELGHLLVGATEWGICAVKLGDDPALLEADLRREYPRAEMRPEGELGAWASALLEHLAGHQPHLDLPIDVQASAFQHRVWQALQAIPYGETRSYQEIAAALDQTSAARAVGRACATNPVAIVIPCHRAIRADGGLGGYRWGLARKEALLEWERQHRERTKPARGES